MKYVQLLPALMVALDVLAALLYAHGVYTGACQPQEWRKVVYWFSAAALTATVTF